MKKNDPVVTQSILDVTLDKKLNKLKDEMIEAFREYREEVLTRMDRDIKELEQIRDDQDFIRHDISDHETRLVKLEVSSK